MTDYIEKKCPKCDQKLRFPSDIGGMLMACPSCGKKFYSDFRLAGGPGKPRQKGVQIFEMPTRFLDRLGRFFTS